MTKQIEVIYSSFIADAKKLASSSDDDDVVVVVVAVDKSRNSCPVFGLLSYLCFSRKMRQLQDPTSEDGS